MMSSDNLLSNVLYGLKAAGVERGSRNRTVAEKTGYSEGTVNGILSGNAKITARFIQAVCSGFGINKAWVETGNGDILQKKTECSIDDRVQHIESIARTFFTIDDRPNIAIPAQELISIGLIFSEMAYRFDGSESAVAAVYRAFEEAKLRIEKPSNPRIQQGPLIDEWKNDMVRKIKKWGKERHLPPTQPEKTK